MRKPNGQSRKGKADWKWASVRWCLSPQPWRFFFLHSFLGVDISHLRTLQGIWTNGFVISPFLPLLRCAFLPFAMNSFIWTCPLPLSSCPLWTPLESYYHCSHPGFGRYVFPLSFFPLFNILSSLFSSLSFFSLPQPDHSHSLKTHLRGLNSSFKAHWPLIKYSNAIFLP